MDYTHRIWLIFSQMSGLSFGHDHKHIDMVSVSKTQIVCTVSARFRPEEVPQLLADTGQDMPRMTSSEGVNYIVFPRY